MTINPDLNNVHEIEPGLPWEVDFFRPEDAEGVVRLFRTVYGEGYPIKTFTDPELLTEENRAGRTISSVVRTSKGDIVGHNALFNSAPWEHLKESGSGLVHPLYRGGKGIFKKMVAHGQEAAAGKFGVQAIFGESLCNHLFSQKTVSSLEWHEMALEVDLMPAEAYAKEGSASGRVSAVLNTVSIVQRPHAVFLPERYMEPLRFVYGDLDDSRELKASSGFPPDGDARIETWVYDFAQVARMAVHEAGRDFALVFEREEKAALSRGVHVIQVWLKLSWPWVGHIVDILRDRGYFLGGVLPRWFDDDGLLMQKIQGTPGWDDINLAFDRAKKILEFVRADWDDINE